ncbi:MAG TPA: MgtC/SapB family protein [Thermoanaerobaculia bacterium]|nr:MgtC/SapB family protein [Thermoanaerobaculia bacterium]
MDPWQDLPGVWPGLAWRLGAALLCGILLGAEREYRDKPAGLRTLTLITFGSALFLVVGELLTRLTLGDDGTTRIDTTRIASQVAVGVGFLGGGAIIQSGSGVHGLTTAAVIWAASAIGLCAGAGFPLLALGVTLVVLLTVTALGPLRQRLSRSGSATPLEVLARNDSLVLARLRAMLADHEVPEDAVSYREAADGQVRVVFRYRQGTGGASPLLDGLGQLDGVHGVPVDLSRGDGSSEQALPAARR